MVDGSGPTVAETLNLLHEGDSVRALVLSVDTDKKKISFSLKPSHFYSDDLRDSDTEQGGSDIEIEAKNYNEVDGQHDFEDISDSEDHVSR